MPQRYVADDRIGRPCGYLPRRGRAPGGPWKASAAASTLTDLARASVRPAGTPAEFAEAARHLYEKHGFDCHEGRGSGPLALSYEFALD